MATFECKTPWGCALYVRVRVRARVSPGSGTPNLEYSPGFGQELELWNQARVRRDWRRMTSPSTGGRSRLRPRRARAESIMICETRTTRRARSSRARHIGRRWWWFEQNKRRGAIGPDVRTMLPTWRAPSSFLLVVVVPNLMLDSATDYSWSLLTYRRRRLPPTLLPARVRRFFQPAPDATAARVRNVLPGRRRVDALRLGSGEPRFDQRPQRSRSRCILQRQ